MTNAAAVKKAAQIASVIQSIGGNPPILEMKSNYNRELIDDPAFWDSDEAYLGDLVEEPPADPAASVSSGGWMDTFAKSLQQLIPAYSQYKIASNQADLAKQLNEINLQRAKIGQPPLNTQQYAQQMVLPQAGVQVGVSPQVSTMLKWGAIIAGIGFGAYLLLGTNRRR